MPEQTRRVDETEVEPGLLLPSLAVAVFLGLLLISVVLGP